MINESCDSLVMVNSASQLNSSLLHLAKIGSHCTSKSRDKAFFKHFFYLTLNHEGYGKLLKVIHCYQLK